MPYSLVIIEVMTNQSNDSIVLKKRVVLSIWTARWRYIIIGKFRVGMQSQNKERGSDKILSVK